MATAKRPEIEPKVHRRILRFLNAAARPRDLVEEPEPPHFFEGEVEPMEEEIEEEAVAEEPARPDGGLQYLDEELAARVIERREHNGAFGFRDIGEFVDVARLRRPDLDRFIHLFGPAIYGSWKVLPYGTQRPNGTAFSIAHAAMLRTGQVLFLPQFDTNETLLWDPTDETNPQFEFPTVQPSEYLFCSGHSFLSDGRLLAAGGGGNFIANAIASGWKFDPIAKAWSKTSGSMSHGRWYPTLVTLGDEPGRVLVTCGTGAGDMEVYRESSDDFVPVTTPAAGARPFPDRYPGMHLLPSGAIFYSRTGWGHGAAGLDLTNAYFTFSGAANGSWTPLTGTMTFPDRREGMSVMLLQPSSPSVRVLAVGGGGHGSTGLDTAEMIDVSALSPATPWGGAATLPEARVHCNAVLLPDGTVFVSGGMPSSNSACRLYDPETDSWYEMDELTSVKTYHSVALLLPSGKVATTGGSNETIEIFSPPYLFRGSRPTITSSPSLVHHGQKFKVETPDAKNVDKVVLVRPMAVTHQTDSEQRVIQLPFKRLGGKKLRATAPNGVHPHSLAPRGYYMLFILRANGVPSVANWFYLH
jgi:WD40 repeat protein